MVALRPTSTISASSTKKLFSSKVSTKKGKIFHALEVEEYNENLTKVTNTLPSTSKSTTSTNAPISSTMSTRNNSGEHTFFLSLQQAIVGDTVVLGY